jgi:hypothetical protein
VKPKFNPDSVSIAEAMYSAVAFEARLLGNGTGVLDDINETLHLLGMPPVKMRAKYSYYQPRFVLVRRSLNNRTKRSGGT